jgi:catechol 2,3-dioxygenase-like lactoylglutathione lyase family enzyme
MDTRVHISLEVANLERSVEFYSRLFQSDPTKLKVDYANFRLETPQLHLALVHNPHRTAEPSSNRHYGIELFADTRLEGWLEKVKASGLETRVEEQTTCCYAVANKFWARDPDGHEWEFWVRHGEADEMHSPEPGSCGTEGSTCCAPEAELTQEAAPKKVSACCAPGKC